VYPGGHLSFTPDELYTLNQVADFSNFMQDTSSQMHPWWSVFGSSLENLETKYFAPFLNTSVFRLMKWFYSGSNLKSLGELDHLVNEVILAKDFDKKDFSGFRAARESERLDNFSSDPRSHFSTDDGWIETSIKISLPAKQVKHASEVAAPQFEVHGLFYRCFLEVLKSALHETTAEQYHLFPFQDFWRPSPDTNPERIFSELYTSDAFINKHEKIRAQPREAGCQLETVVAAVMLWSYSMHLTSFGNASLWPIYMFLGNLSKYTRGKLTSFAAHHLAYIPKVCMS
jgi:hypothetical protein